MSLWSCLRINIQVVADVYPPFLFVCTLFSVFYLPEAVVVVAVGGVAVLGRALCLRMAGSSCQITTAAVTGAAKKTTQLICPDLS
jgi:hypothetical protein